MSSNSEAIMGNWIALSRDVAGHWLVGFGQAVSPANPNRGAYSRSEAWIDLIMLARWKAGAEVNKGKKVDLEIGQLQGGYSFLALRWNWTLKQVRSFLEKLVIERMIDKGQPEDCLPSACPQDEQASNRGKQRGNQIQVITLCNYRKYQIAWEVRMLMEGQAEGKQGASEGQHLNTETKKQDISPDGDMAQLALDPDPERLTASKAARLAFDRYNETARRCGLSQASKLTDARKRALALRVKEAGGLDGFGKAMANLERSAFLQGQNDRSWKADLDWLIQPAKFTRLLEGGYGNGAHAPEYRGNSSQFKERSLLSDEAPPPKLRPRCEVET